LLTVLYCFYYIIILLGLYYFITFFRIVPIQPLGCNIAINVSYIVSVAGVHVWNALPVDVTSAPSLFTFRKRLKLHLFSLSYTGQVC